MTRPPARRWCYLATLIALCPLAADAAPGDLTDAARKVMSEAGDAANRSDWALCRTKAVGVWDKFKRPSVASLLGSCEAELGMNREAAEHLDFFLQHDDKSNAKQTAAAQEHYPMVRSKLMLVVVDCNEADFDVRVDGEAKAAASARIFLEPGHHTIEIRKDGFTPDTSTIDATAAGEKKLSIKLVPVGTGAGGSGLATPSTGSGTIDTGAGGARPVGARRSFVPAIVGYGVGAIGIGVGAGFLVAHSSERSDAEKLAKGRHCSGAADATCKDVIDKTSQANRSGNIGAASMIVGGVGIVAGTGLLVWALLGPRREASAVRVLPVVGGREQGLIVEGQF